MPLLQIISKFLYFYPLQIGYSIYTISFLLSFFISLWASLRLFSFLASRNRIKALIASTIWYIVLFIYFAIFISNLPRYILLNLKFPPELILRAYFAPPDIAFASLALLFVILGSFSLFFFSQKIPKLESAYSLIKTLWLATRKPLLVAFLIYLSFIFLNVPLEITKGKTEKVIQEIRSKKITLADVMGENLPLPPDPELKDATIEGIDANQNGIRDDVELAIFEAYPDSARIRAVLLQYALNFQLEATIDLINPETVTAVAEEGTRAVDCFATLLRDYIFNLKGKTADEILSMDEEKLNEMSIIEDELFKFVYNLQHNTPERIKASKEFYKGNLRSFGDSPVNKTDCDVDLENLPN